MNTWHCVNQKGEVLFSLEENSSPTTNFSNNMAIVDKTKIVNKEGIVLFNAENGGYQILVGTDTEGNDLGTNSRGFVFAKRTLATVNGEEVQIGLLNNLGEWELEPGSDITNTRYCGDGQFDIGYEYPNRMMYNSKTKEKYTIFDEFKVYNRLKFNNGYAVDITDTNSAPVLFDEYGNTKTISGFTEPDYSDVYVGMYSYELFYFYGKAGGGEKIFFRFYDSTGSQIIDLSGYNLNLEQYPYFEENHCLVRTLGEDGGAQFTIIDRTGTELFPLRSGDVSKAVISNGLLKVLQPEDAVDFVDMQGNLIVSLNFFDNSQIDVSKQEEGEKADIGVFSNGFLKVGFNKAGYYLDKEGQKLTVDFS
ncbi:MAG: hypothetical protein ACK5L3_12610 [Oscillospiraceae bacterium]